jgi:hypothetical protein
MPTLSGTGKLQTITINSQPTRLATARYAEQANSYKVKVSGPSHAVYVSRPKEVVALIEEAATRVRAKTL